MSPAACNTPAWSQLSLQSLLLAQHDTPVLLSLFDRHDFLQWANPAFRQAFGLDPVQQMTWMDLMRHNHQRSVGALIQTQDFELWLASAHSRRGKVAFRGFECDLRDGRWLWMTETISTDGSMLCVACDITAMRTDSRELRQARDVAQRAALTDALTGISNRAHILSQLEQQLPHTRIGSHCGIALMDLDFFKKINDTYGHASGDIVLQHFAQMLRQVMRREDGFGRFGGEEFLVMLPGVQLPHLRTSLERLLQLLAHERPLPEHPDFAYSCSVGATMLLPTDSIASALHRADMALYQAKAEGRNRIVQA